MFLSSCQHTRLDSTVSSATRCSQNEQTPRWPAATDAAGWRLAAAISGMEEVQSIHGIRSPPPAAIFGQHCRDIMATDWGPSGTPPERRFSNVSRCQPTADQSSALPVLTGCFTDRWNPSRSLRMADGSDVIARIISAGSADGGSTQPLSVSGICRASTFWGVKACLATGDWLDVCECRTPSYELGVWQSSGAVLVDGLWCWCGWWWTSRRRNSSTVLCNMTM